MEVDQNKLTRSRVWGSRPMRSYAYESTYSLDSWRTEFPRNRRPTWRPKSSDVMPSRSAGKTGLVCSIHPYWGSMTHVERFGSAESFFVCICVTRGEVHRDSRQVDQIRKYRGVCCSSPFGRKTMQLRAPGNLSLAPRFNRMVILTAKRSFSGEFTEKFTLPTSWQAIS